MSFFPRVLKRISPLNDIFQLQDLKEKFIKQDPTGLPEFVKDSNLRSALVICQNFS